MKKSIVISCVFFLISFAGVTGAMADTITINAPLALNSLYGESADELYSKWYSWALDYEDLGIPDDYYITSAHLFIDNVYNSDSAPTSNNLYIDLLNNPKPNISSIGYTWGYDLKNGIGVLAGDYFLLSGTYDLDQLMDYSDTDPGSSSSRVDLLIDVTPYLISVLMDDDDFGFGFDPDCYFKNSGVSLVVQTSPVPIPPSLLLLGSGVFGLIMSRGRRKR